MNQHKASVVKVLASALAAMLLNVGSAEAQSQTALSPQGPVRDPASLTPMRRMTIAQRAAAAKRAEERRKENEDAGRLEKKPKHQLEAPAARPSPKKQPQAPANSSSLGTGGGTSLQAAASALLNLALAQVGAADPYANPNFATSKWPIAHCAGPGSNAAELCQKDSDCTGYLPPYLIGPDVYASAATCTGPVVPFTGIQKFKDTLPGLCPLGSNNLGNCIPVATPNTTAFAGSDYYELGLKDYNNKFHSDMPAGARSRGYYQKNNVPGGLDPAGEAARNHYLGPLIIATTNRPVRIKFTNDLATSAAGGNLFIPMDNTLSGTGLGADGLPYSQNRATIHLHGGNTPWISDGTQHQWTAPKLEPTTHKKGLAVGYVPDMWFDAAGAPLPTCNGQLTCALAGATNNPGDGALTFYYTNQQSGRLMFYHDHAYGITRLNVYAGEAAGYLLVNPPDEDRLAAANVPGTLGAAFDVTHVVPLVIQDRTFVPPAYQLSQQDPTWDAAKWSGEDGLWMPHVYMPNQWPGNPDSSNTNPMGRWDYGPWFWPVQTSLVEVDQNGVAFNRPLTVPCTSASAVSALNPNGDTDCPSTPNPSLVPEAFLDTPVVNGTAYPTFTVDPASYRFQILNAAGERNFNLSLFVADASGTEVALVPAVPHLASSTQPICSGTAPISAVTGTPNGPDLATPTCYPREWPTDGRQGGVPDPAAAGPQWLQIGTEGGLLPIPAIVPPRPVVYEQNKRNIVVLNVASKSLFMGPAERADVVVDFRAYAGKTLIVYNDAPAPVPAGDPRQDFYTGGPDFTTMGGAPTPLPGYGPNTRTVMQIKVRATPLGGAQTPVNLPAVTTALADSFRLSLPNPLVPQSAYNSVYNPPVPYTDTYLPIQALNLTFTPIGETTPLNLNFGNKALHELFTTSYGRMNSLLAMEIPNTNWLNQTTIPFTNFDPPTEYLPDGSPQIWKITHNGVDTHTIHFHLFSVQIVNRVGWDGQVRVPDANELGWKESVRMNPLEDVILALRPVKQTLPWALPDMVRPLDVDRALGSSSQFTGVDIYNIPILVTNQNTNFGQEYVWHCHLLGHEEEDMLRAEILVVAPETPTGMTVARTGVTVALRNQARLNWTDPSKSAQGFTVQRARNSTFTTGLTTFAVAKPATQPGPVTFLDTTATFNVIWYYRIQATKTLSSAADPTTLYNAPSAWTPTVRLGSGPIASVSPTSLTFAAQAVGTPSAAQVLTWSNSGNATLTTTSRTITGANFADFAISATTCTANLAAPVAPATSRTCTISVRFTPLSGGPATASLVIASNDGLNPTITVPLTGTGSGAAATVAPAALTFADQGLASTSAAQVVTVTNGGSTALTLGSPGLAGANPGDFARTSTCLATLGVGSSCTISVTFTPTVAGVRAATLSLTTSDPVNPTFTVTLDGNGIPAATGVTLTPDQPSPHTNGLPVKFTAVGSGPVGIPFGAYQYRFWINNGTGAVMVQDYSATATWTMPSTTVGATYTVTVDVRTSTGALTPNASASVVYVFNHPVATGVTLTPNLPSPHAVNIVPVPVVFTALGSGSVGYNYQFSTSIDAGLTWTVQQTYSAAATWTMTTTVLGTYRVRVEVKTNLGALTADVSTFVDYVLASPAPPTGVSLTPSLPSPQPPTTAVLFTAAGIGSSGYQYQFWLNSGTGAVVMQAWGAGTTWTLPSTTPLGSYTVTVDARTSTAPAAPIASTSVVYLIDYPPATGVTLVSNLPSPHPINIVPVPVVFTAAGIGSTGYNYQFSTSIDAGVTWTVQQVYGTTATWTMTTTVLGTYRVRAEVKTNPGSLTADATAFVDYQLVAPAPATGVTLTPSVASPQIVGTAVTFTAQGSGSLGYDYQFWLSGDGGASWTMVQGYGAGSTWTMSSAQSAGTYILAVYVRTTTAVALDTYASISYQLTSSAPPTPATSVALNASPTSPVAAGTPVLFSAVGAGSTLGGAPSPPGSYQYQFWLSSNAGASWSIVQNYGIGSTWTLDATNPAGNYTVVAYVRTTTGVPLDAFASVGYQLTIGAPPTPATPATGITVTATPGSPSAHGAPVVFDASGTGSTTGGSPTLPSGYDYQYWLSSDGGATWAIVQNYGGGPTWALDATHLAGSYTVVVYVRTTTTVGLDTYTSTVYTLL